MAKQHIFNAKVTWTGNKGLGTKDYLAYDRSHTVSINNKIDILCSSDKAFHGDSTKHNPEDLFLSSLATCHMLWYLHIAADNGIIVVEYVDNASGTMIQTETGGGHFTEATLHPVVTIMNSSQIDLANSLHKVANQKCFIANSCNFEVKHEAVCRVQEH